MKLDILFLCSIVGVGLALVLERFLQPVSSPTPASTLTLTLTGDPVRDYMNGHY